jgi:hypothetical protein
MCLDNTVYDVSGNNNGRIDPGETVDITATIKNIGGVDFTSLNTTIECTDPYITITDNSGYFGFIAVDSTKENTNDPYVVSASASAPSGHIADFQLIATEGAFVDTFSFSFVIGSYQYMVWNPDPTPGPGMELDSILTTMGYSGYYATDLITGGELAMYQTIFACVGIYSNNYVVQTGSPEATALESYLNAGGNMYLEGGDVWYYDPLGSGYNFCPLFGIQALSDGTGDGGPFVGEVGTFTQDMYFQYGGENSFIDHIDPMGTGFLIFHDEDNNYNCGVANDAGTHKTVGLSFEMGGLIDAGGGLTRQALLDSIMDFFDITPSVEEITKLDVETPRLHLYPNPARYATAISWQITDNSEFKLRVFDITGRLVKDLSGQSSVTGNQSSVTWHGSDERGRRLPAGIYFIQLDTETHSETQKIILVE